MAPTFPPFRLRASIAPAVFLALASGRAHAQGAPAQDLGGSVFQLLFGLAVVIALVFASLWLLKKLSAPRGEAAGLLRVVAGTAVGPRERVVIVEVGGSWLVLGVAPGRVTALADLPRGELPPAPSSTEGADFAGRLRRMIDRGHAS